MTYYCLLALIFNPSSRQRKSKNSKNKKRTTLIVSWVICSNCIRFRRDYKQATRGRKSEWVAIKSDINIFLCSKNEKLMHHAQLHKIFFWNVFLLCSSTFNTFPSWIAFNCWCASRWLMGIKWPHICMEKELQSKCDDRLKNEKIFLFTPAPRTIRTLHSYIHIWMMDHLFLLYSEVEFLAFDVERSWRTLSRIEIIISYYYSRAHDEERI